MNTLLLNTCFSKLQLGLWRNDELLELNTHECHNNMADMLLDRIESLLGQQDLTRDDVQRLICVVGPGSFTGTRIGVSAVNAWQFARGLVSCGLSVFDLYSEEVMTVVSANAREAWVRIPGHPPQFFDRDGLPFRDDFDYCGEVSDTWHDTLRKQGGRFRADSFRFPLPSQLHFDSEMLRPWYYKEAHITWSNKHHSSQIRPAKV